MRRLYMIIKIIINTLKKMKEHYPMTLKNEKNQTLQITLPESMVQEFDQISKSKGYQTRSQALKDIISKFIEESKC